jgi:zinc protease
MALTKKMIPIQHWLTKTGIPVFFVERKEIPIVEISVIFNAGSRYDNKLYGIANLTNELIDQGTEKFNLHEITSGFENAGSQFYKAVDRDKAAIGFRCLSNPNYLNKTLVLFEEILNRPSFPDFAFIRLKNLILSAINYQQQMPDLVAKNSFYANVYGNHPYSHSILGTEKSVAQLTLEEIKTFYQHHYVSNKATITIVGDLNQKQASRIVNKLVANLESGKSPHLISFPIEPLAKEIVIPFPSQQTHILIGQAGVTHDSNYFPIIVGNQILGGSTTTSRLFKVIREKQGLAYTAISSATNLMEGGPFMIIMQTRNQEAKKALKITLNILDEFLTRGPTTKDLAAIKNKIINSFPFTLSSNQDIAEHLQKIAFYGLPLDYLDQFTERVAQVNKHQILEAFQQALPLHNMTTVMVGDC